MIGLSRTAQEMTGKPIFENRTSERNTYLASDACLFVRRDDAAHHLRANRRETERSKSDRRQRHRALSPDERTTKGTGNPGYDPLTECVDSCGNGKECDSSRLL